MLNIDDPEGQKRVSERIRQRKLIQKARRGLLAEESYQNNDLRGIPDRRLEEIYLKN